MKAPAGRRFAQGIGFGLRAVALAYLLVLALAGCEKARQDMYDQPRYKPLGAGPLFSDGAADRPPPAGTVAAAEGVIAGTSSARAGGERAAADAAALAAERQPYPVTAELLNRGQERFEIYCQPCHGPVGDGDGLVARRGFPHPPSYHIDRLRAAPDRHFFDVIGNGYGVMYPYGDRVRPADRWAIVAYIRALQLSQHADAARLPPATRAQLAAATGEAP